MAILKIPPSREAKAEDELQYGAKGSQRRREIDDKYPDRPRNHAKTLPFHDLFKNLFDPLESCKKKPTGPTIARAKQGPHGPMKLSPVQMKFAIIDRFVSRWRSDVGNDFYPAIRLICPDQDRDRPMYGLKERALGKLLVKLMKLNPASEDGHKLLNWKLPGKSANKMAGDFAGIAYDVLSKRAMRSEPGNMTMAEVNELLDDLAAAQKEESQLPVFQEFYNKMNASELMWLIRIVMRQMKVGASENTFLDKWHPDGMSLFNVCSSLRTVCWRLQDPEVRLEGEDASGIQIMECFQPQLAQYQASTFKVMLEKMGVMDEPEPEKDKDGNPKEKEDEEGKIVEWKPEFWIEEKLDGERMQMHMDIEDDGHARFSFWSRKGKDYTYLYGSNYDDENSALTRFIKGAFEERVYNIILDGEMVTWDPERNKIVAFGTLKTAALGQQRNGNDRMGIRPLYKVFDCVYLNDRDLTSYELRDRYKALDGAFTDVPGRMQKLEHKFGHSEHDIEPELRSIIESQGEGLVLKNPKSTYELASRNNNWMKVKPEYMLEFGESLDCLIIGGYYGQGHRGGALASFLCGLRVDQNMIQSQGADPMKFLSFFKVGGGFRAEDYANIRHQTDGKWKDWDPNNPPTQYIELAGKKHDFERPDQWILPSDSIVVQCKAASVGESGQFRTGFTLRFPRFQRLRTDKDWQSALTHDGFILLRQKTEAGAKERRMTVDSSRKKISKRFKKETVIAGADSKIKTPYAGPKTQALEGMTFCVLSEMLTPVKKSKAEVEEIIKSNGGTVTQNPRPKHDGPHVICIAEKRVVKVASLIKDGNVNIVKPSWILDTLKQAEEDGPGKEKFVIPYEPAHMFAMAPGEEHAIRDNVDIYGDSYARDSTADELKRTLTEMVLPKTHEFSSTAFLSELEERGKGIGEMPGSLFRGCVSWFAPIDEERLSAQEQIERRILLASYMLAGGRIAISELNEGVTHFVATGCSPESGKELSAIVGGLARRKIPRLVQWVWLRDSWAEKTLLDEERYAI